jgi:hypothetical protein|tara:strand:+ start:407 stop:724 length:318 start_codon:yes stop_codon:yes gene_type:complete
MAGVTFKNITSNAILEVSAQRINLEGVIFHNDDSGVRFLQFFNSASGSITLGSTTPVFTVQLPANTSQDFDFHNALFTTALSVACTQTATNDVGPTSVWVAIIHR